MLPVSKILIRSTKFWSCHTMFLGRPWSPGEAIALWPHKRSSEVIRVHKFGSITRDKIDIETWQWNYCVCLVQPHRQICNMAYHLPGSIHNLDLISNFQIELSRSSGICVELGWREKHDGVSYFPTITRQAARSYLRKTIDEKLLFDDF